MSEAAETTSLIWVVHLASFTEQLFTSLLSGGKQLDGSHTYWDKLADLSISGTAEDDRLSPVFLVAMANVALGQKQ